MDLDKKDLRKAAQAFGAVTEVVIYTVAGYFLGQALDRQFGSSPWIAGLLTFLGFVGGFYRMYRLIKQDDASTKSNGTDAT